MITRQQNKRITSITKAIGKTSADTLLSKTTFFSDGKISPLATSRGRLEDLQWNVKPFVSDGET